MNERHARADAPLQVVTPGVELRDAAHAGEVVRPAGPSAAAGSTPRASRLDKVLFALSMAGVPIGVFALRRLGRLGGVLLEIAVGALGVRAVTMVAAGTTHRLQIVPRLLLFVETAADVLGAVAGCWAWVWRPFIRPAIMQQSGGGTTLHRRRTRAEESGSAWVTSAAIAAWMGAMIVHSARMAIYIGPGRGLRTGANRES